MSAWSKLLHAVFISECDFCERELHGKDFNRVCKHCAVSLKQLVKQHLFSARCVLCDQVLLKENLYKPKRKKAKTLPLLRCDNCSEGSESTTHSEHLHFRITNRSLFSSNIHNIPKSVSAKTPANLAQKLVYDFKFRKHPSYAKIIAYLSEKYFLPYLASFDLLVPIPLSTVGLLERGFCQVTAVTKLFAKRLLIPQATLIKRNESRYQVPQHEFTRAERINLIAGKYLIQNQALKRVSDVKNILLIDDIYTTGATLQHVAELIHQHLPEANIGSFTFLRTSLNPAIVPPKPNYQQSKE